MLELRIRMNHRPNQSQSNWNSLKWHSAAWQRRASKSPKWNAKFCSTFRCVDSFRRKSLSIPDIPILKNHFDGLSYSKMALIHPHFFMSLFETIFKFIIKTGKKNLIESSLIGFNMTHQDIDGRRRKIYFIHVKFEYSELDKIWEFLTPSDSNAVANICFKHRVFYNDRLKLKHKQEIFEASQEHPVLVEHSIYVHIRSN